LDNDRVAKPIKGFFNVYANQLKGSLCLLCILYEVGSKERGFLNAFSCHESVLMISNDSWKRSGQSLSYDSGRYFVEHFQHAERTEVSWCQRVWFLGNVDHFSVFNPLKTVVRRQFVVEDQLIYGSCEDTRDFLEQKFI
jgi:hypothetical protein